MAVLPTATNPYHRTETTDLLREFKRRVALGVCVVLYPDLLAHVAGLDLPVACLVLQVSPPAVTNLLRRGKLYLTQASLQTLYDLAERTGYAGTMFVECAAPEKHALWLGEKIGFQNSCGCPPGERP